MYFNGTAVVASFRILCLLLGKTVAQPPPNNNNVVQKMEQLKMKPLKYLSKFRRSLERLLINIIVELKLRSTAFSRVRAEYSVQMRKKCGQE